MIDRVQKHQKDFWNTLGKRERKKKNSNALREGSLLAKKKQTGPSLTGHPLE